MTLYRHLVLLFVPSILLNLLSIIVSVHSIMLLPFSNHMRLNLRPATNLSITHLLDGYTFTITVLGHVKLLAIFKSIWKDHVRHVQDLLLVLESVCVGRSVVV